MGLGQRTVLGSKVLAGRSVIHGTRLIEVFIIALLAQDWTLNDIIENYPRLEREEV